MLLKLLPLLFYVYMPYTVQKHLSHSSSHKINIVSHLRTADLMQMFIFGTLCFIFCDLIYDYSAACAAYPAAVIIHFPYFSFSFPFAFPSYFALHPSCMCRSCVAACCRGDQTERRCQNTAEHCGCQWWCSRSPY